MVSKREGSALTTAGDLDAVARELTLRGVAPRVAVACGARRPGGWVSAIGGEDAAIFDLASLTKPMTAVAVALEAATSGALSPSSRLGGLSPYLEGTASAGATLDLLLAHRAGLEGHIAVFMPLLGGAFVDPVAALRSVADARRAGCEGDPPEGGFPPLYSDLGYALVGDALARHTASRDAGEAIERTVVARLGQSAALGTARGLEARGVDVVARAAPTEDVPWRGGLVVGRVHDENAWALTGPGGSGHAGMFGTAGSVLAFGQAVLDGLEGRGPFAGADLGWLVRERPGGTLRAGFDGKSAEGSSAGARFGPRSFGHLGFTGTSLWIDPDARVVAVLLTNRVWPTRTRAQAGIRTARPWAHDALHAIATSRAARPASSGV